MSKPYVVSTINCKSLCFSVTKTNIGSTLAPTVQGSTTQSYYVALMLFDVTRCV